MSDKTTATNLRTRGIERPYSAADVATLAGYRAHRVFAGAPGRREVLAVARERTRRRRTRLHDRQPGGTGRAGGPERDLLSGWQVAGDGNTAGEMYPDQSLYPVDSVPQIVERINNALIAHRPDPSPRG